MVVMEVMVHMVVKAMLEVMVMDTKHPMHTVDSMLLDMVMPERVMDMVRKYPQKAVLYPHEVGGGF